MLRVTSSDVSHGTDILVHVLLLSNQCCIPATTYWQHAYIQNYTSSDIHVSATRISKGKTD